MCPCLLETPILAEACDSGWTSGGRTTGVGSVSETWFPSPMSTCGSGWTEPCVTTKSSAGLGDWMKPSEARRHPSWLPFGGGSRFRRSQMNCMPSLIPMTCWPDGMAEKDRCGVKVPVDGDYHLGHQWRYEPYEDRPDKYRRHPAAGKLRRQDAPGTEGPSGAATILLVRASAPCASRPPSTQNSRYRLPYSIPTSLP